MIDFDQAGWEFLLSVMNDEELEKLYHWFSTDGNYLLYNVTDEGYVVSIEFKTGVKNDD